MLINDVIHNFNFNLVFEGVVLVTDHDDDV